MPKIMNFTKLNQTLKKGKSDGMREDDNMLNIVPLDKIANTFSYKSKKLLDKNMKSDFLF